MSHPAWDAWIEILRTTRRCLDTACRIPHGMRGLKYVRGTKSEKADRSHPAWDAWIEMLPSIPMQQYSSSHPAWDAWIEILWLPLIFPACHVASRMGCVD